MLYLLRRLGSFCPLLLGAVLIAGTGCDSGRSDVSGPNFGDPYEVVTEVPSANGSTIDVTPRQAKRNLAVTVTYSGGCAAHTFRAEAQRAGDTAEMWLVHDGGDDPCEAFIYQSLNVPLPEVARTSPAAVLLAPDGATYTLRTP